ncbi:uncharacterized protein EMH_0061050 [Eimeria mitis]|uniref:Transmembrane protein n=1 Tax=Eimeria mitis TaxID=44415 RepID=U6JZ74_9EIME|nr:uncharacterized protein EMH_0061050 [Eimeria mitis]CDJ30744.1 hypothetical protein EMH_0061050 [Eimeria mitis]
MGNMRRIAGDLSPKASDPLEVAGEGTDPAPDNADNSGIAATAGGASPSWRYRGKRARATTAAIAAVAVIVVCGVRYIMSGRSPSYVKASQLGLVDASQPSVGDVSEPSLDDVSEPSLDDASQLPLDDASMQKYMNDFNEAAEEMEKAFPKKSSVRKAFQLNFTPSLEDGENLLKNPLAIIKDHVAKMRECKVPSASSPQARRDFAQHLQLLRSICRATTLRVNELTSFSVENKQFRVALPFFRDGEPSSHHAHKDLAEWGGMGWDAAHFLRSWGLSAGYSDRQVPGAFAFMLRWLLEIEKRYNDANLNARYYFMEFLQPFEGDGTLNPAHAPAEHKIPYTGKPFRTSALADAAAHVFRESDATTNYAFVRKLNRIADNWSNEGVAAAVKQQEKENVDNAQERLETKRELMRRLLSEGIPEDDLVIIALFLL